MLYSFSRILHKCFTVHEVSAGSFLFTNFIFLHQVFESCFFSQVHMCPNRGSGAFQIYNCILFVHTSVLFCSTINPCLMFCNDIIQAFEARPVHVVDGSFALVWIRGVKFQLTSLELLHAPHNGTKCGCYPALVWLLTTMCRGSVFHPEKGNKIKNLEVFDTH